MALTDILKKIQKETEDKLKKIEDEHKAKLKKLEEEYEAKKKQAAAEMEKRVAANVEKIHQKAEILAKMEGKNALLREKRNLINTVFEEAIKKLASGANYTDILTELLKHDDLGFENAEIIPAKGKEAETKDALSKSGRKYQMSSESADITGGFIVKADKIAIDNSFESIIGKELRSELELEIAKVLF